METPQILLVRACAIGDFVFNLPALAAWREFHGEARFTLVGNPSSLELARNVVVVDKIHSLDLPPWSRLFYEPVPDLKFDGAIVWMKDATVAGNLIASGIPNVVRADPFPAFGHAADHLLRTLNLPRPRLPDLWTPTLSNIMVHPGSGSAKKNWPFFQELMRRAPEKCIALPQDRSLAELSDFLQTVNGFVGNDSGVTHLAAYLGVPTIALFGPTDPRIWGPIGRRCRTIWKSKLEDISVNEVLKAIALWNGRLNRS